MNFPQIRTIVKSYYNQFRTNKKMAFDLMKKKND
jgi:hypothetical protein